MNIMNIYCLSFVVPRLKTVAMVKNRHISSPFIGFGMGLWIIEVTKNTHINIHGQSLFTHH